MIDDFKDWVIGGLAAIVASLFGGWLAMVSFFAKRQAARVDELYKLKANKDSTDKRFEDTLDAINNHIEEDRDMHQRIGEKIDRTNDNLTQTNVSLAKLVGRFERGGE